MQRRAGACIVTQTRGVQATGVALTDDRPRLVEREPSGHSIRQPLEHYLGIIGEPVRSVTVEPATGILKDLRQVPVEEGHHWLDAPLQQRVDHTLVVVETGAVDLSGARGKNPGPCDGEAICVYAESTHRRDVLDISMVVIRRDVAVVAI